jgi:GNAT superfamily N-acetyltransferase
MASITVRAARPGDKQALARIHSEVARYYRDLAADYFATLERAAEQFAAEPGVSDSTTLHLVAEVDGEVVGTLVAKLLPAEDEAASESGPERDVSRLRIEYLATAATSRRKGVGTRLVEAAETWGREAGATIAETTAYHGSALSEPFWGERMSYEERSVNLRKAL